MSSVLEQGKQCALLAPTEILAKQHLATLQKYFGLLRNATTHSEMQEDNREQNGNSKRKKQHATDAGGASNGAGAGVDGDVGTGAGATSSSTALPVIPAVEMISGSLKGKAREALLKRLRSGV